MDFKLFLDVHNITRWAVLAFGVLALISSYSGLFSKRSWQTGDKIIGLGFNITFGIQLILGLILYSTSDLIRPLMSNPSLISGGNVELIFFGIYHIVVMLIAFILAQIGYSRSKRAESDRVKFRLATIFYTLAILLVFLAIPWGIRPNWPG